MNIFFDYEDNLYYFFCIVKLTKIIANLYLTVSLKMPRRFRAKDTVWMELDDMHEDLLREMTLVDESDNTL